MYPFPDSDKGMHSYGQKHIRIYEHSSSQDRTILSQNNLSCGSFICHPLSLHVYLFLTSGNHQLVFHFGSFVISRTLYEWNHTGYNLLRLAFFFIPINFPFSEQHINGKFIGIKKKSVVVQGLEMVGEVTTKQSERIMENDGSFLHLDCSGGYITVHLSKFRIQIHT